MKMKLNKKGFTLIEVVLVLAIGGLIFLLAFLAFQQVSTNRRDTQRRNDAGRVLSEIQNAKGDGAGPTDATSLATFITNYFGGSVEGPQGPYTFNWQGANGPATMANNNMYIGRGTCSSTNTLTHNANGGYVVIAKLEKAVVCRQE